MLFKFLAFVVWSIFVYAFGFEFGAKVNDAKYAAGGEKDVYN